MINQIELRSLLPSDEDVLYTLVKENRPQLSQWLDWASMIQTRDDFAQFFRYYESQIKQRLMEVQVICYQDQVIGIVEAHGINYSQQSAYLSYWLDGHFQNKGMMTKGMQQFLDYLYKNWAMKHFFLVIQCQNVRSIRLAQKLGFHLEGYAREFEFEAQFQPDCYFFHLNYQP